MPIEPRYVVSTSASALHAAAALLEGAALVDPKMAEALAREVDELGVLLATIGLARERFFEHAAPLAVRFDAPRAWADVLVTKTMGPREQDGTIAERLARALVAIEAAFQRGYPQALEELERRSTPLREQWEARGPGLMKTLERLTVDDLLVAEADVILVQPALGGAGAAFPAYNSVLIEAVLVNPLRELPEVLRLGWLLAQLNLDLPKYEELVPRGRLFEIGPLAMVPPILAAAEEVELARLDERTLATALEAWRLRASDPARLLEWWEAWQAGSGSWSVAIAALARLLSDDSQ